jgi:uncharacterized protein (TIGR03000 family)
MRRTLAIAACCLFLTSSTRGDEPLAPDGMPIRNLRGLLIIRQGDQTTVSLGGGIFPRKVKVTTRTPDGPVVTRFTLPSMLRGPNDLPQMECASAFLRVEIPDHYGVLYVEGVSLGTKGLSRPLESPPLQPGRGYPLHLRAVYAIGDKILIEDKQVAIRAGDNVAVTFDGSHALAVPMPVRRDLRITEQIGNAHP